MEVEGIVKRLPKLTFTSYYNSVKDKLSPLTQELSKPHSQAEQENIIAKIGNLFADNKFNVEIRDSSITGAGKGVFATTNIPQLMKVGTFWGYKNSSSNAYDPDDDASYSTYAAGIPTIDPADPSTNQLYTEFRHCPPLFINEPPPGTMPNCAWRYRDSDEEYHEIWTCRDIEAGEELFVFYGISYDREYEAHTDTIYMVDLDKENTLHLFEDGEEIDSREYNTETDDYFVST